MQNFGEALALTPSGSGGITPAAALAGDGGPKTPEKQQTADEQFLKLLQQTADEQTADELLNPADPNLLCAVCHHVFTQPVRTQCGHVFCASCLHTWLPLKAECPECRAHVDSEKLTPDRLAESLVSNLQGFCPLRKAGCLWVGKRGDRTAHLARDCLCVPVYCPNPGCGAEMPRKDVASHLECCPHSPQCQELVDCPYGCGARCATSDLDAHRTDCLYEPRKLLAVVNRLVSENERLVSENRRLRELKPMAGTEAVAEEAVAAEAGQGDPRTNVRKAPRRTRVDCSPDARIGRGE